MPGESQQPPVNAPDPSVYVTEAIDRASKSEREWVAAQLAVLVQRFEDVDKATKVLSETVNRTPTEIQKEVGHLKELVTESMRSAQALVAYQTECSDKAATKQEAAFAKQIDALAVLLQKMNDTLSDRINDVKTRVDGIDNRKLGGTQERTDNRMTIGFAITVGFFVLAIVGFIITQVATAPTP